MTLLKKVNKVKRSFSWKKIRKVLRIKKKEEKVSEECLGNELQFDAVPDDSRGKNHNNSPHHSESEDIYKDYKSDEGSSYFKQEKNGSKETNAEERFEKPKKSKCSSKNDSFSFSSFDEETQNGPSILKNEYNINVNGKSCVGVHIGNSFHQENTIYGQPQNAEKTEKKTKAVKNLLKCQDNVQKMDGEYKGHLQYLAKCFGSRWKEIGKSLGVTAHDLDVIKENYNDREQRSYQMLKVWCENQGNNITVGYLCKKLWNTNVPAAQQAVEKLSKNIEDIE